MTNSRISTPFRPAAIAIGIALTLGGCDWVGGNSSDTQLRNVEILPGTASDEMITLDQASGDGTSIDTSVATGPALPGAPSTGGDAAADASATDDASPAATAADSGGDVTIRPPAGGAERSE